MQYLVIYCVNFFPSFLVPTFQINAILILFKKYLNLDTKVEFSFSNLINKILVYKWIVFIGLICILELIALMHLN
jgi:hypothetical protein